MQIKIRDIQHFLYCPHRWGLMEIDRAWAENYFVVKANLMHERVHDPEKSYSLRGKRVLNGQYVFLDTPPYEIYGVLDCIELTADPKGVAVDDSGKRYKLCIVEYKPSAPKDLDFYEEDAMQVFAQKLCVDNIFSCDCSCEMYYAKEKQRKKLPFSERHEELDNKLQETLGEMREYMQNGIIPKRESGQKCSGCSMKDLCMPMKEKRGTTQSRIKTMLREELP